MTQRGMRADHHRSKGRQHLLPHRLIKELRVRLLGYLGRAVSQKLRNDFEADTFI